MINIFKIKLSLFLTLLLGGCSLDVSPENELHFVRVVLPSNEASIGVQVILDIENREPMKQTLAENFDLNSGVAPEFYFEVGPDVAPATLEVRYVSGEMKKLNKVIFDTTLTLQ